MQTIVKDYLHSINNDALDAVQEDYLIQLLQDEDAYQDVDGLVDTVQQLLQVDDGSVQIYAKDLVSRAMTEVCTDSQTTDKADYNDCSKENCHEDHAGHTQRSVGGSQSASQIVYDNTTSLPSSPSSEEDSEKIEKRALRKERLKQKREERKLKKQRKELEKNKRRAKKLEDKDSLPVLPEDEASAWKDCQETGVVWGGRGKGGRGEYAGAVNSVKSNIHLTNVSISLDNGMDLLTNSTMDIVKGHRYGLIGRNGCGKSTLLKRLAEKAVPGIPHDIRIMLVHQQIEGTDESSLRTLLRADKDREALLNEQYELENSLESVTNIQVEDVGQRLGDIAAELDAISADTAEDRAMEILLGLQFTKGMILGPTKNLSGGWRMRLAIAQSLFVQSDLLLADEITNHLSIRGLEWLINYLNRDKDRTMIVVSHDRHFLDAVCSDIVVLSHQQLEYHVGNYSEYQRQQQDKTTREAQILDAAERQRARAEAFIQKQQASANKKNADPNKQRQAKMIREKKLDRIGNYREDGKKYKLNSLKKLSEDHVRLAQKVHIKVEDPVIKMKFPEPVWPSSIGPSDSVIRLENFTLGFEAGNPLILNTTLSVHRGSKIAVVGENGCGKTSLMNVLSNADGAAMSNSGSFWIHPSVRIGHVSQYAVEELESLSSMTVLEYTKKRLASGSASSRITSKADGNIRQYLGAFGLGGRHALQSIGRLSGGERMRLCFATVLANQPHILILDEATNHVDLETLDSMSEALNAFGGSVLMVSHNQGFLSGFCNELWVVDKKRIAVNHSDTATFDEIFSDYRNSVFHSSGSRSNQRRDKADMAKRANKQHYGIGQRTALF